MNPSEIQWHAVPDIDLMKMATQIEDYDLAFAAVTEMDVRNKGRSVPPFKKNVPSIQELKRRIRR